MPRGHWSALAAVREKGFPAQPAGGRWRFELITYKNQNISKWIKHLGLLQILGIDRKVQAFVEGS